MSDQRPVTIDLGRPEDAVALGAILSDWVTGAAWMPRLHDHGDDRLFCEHLIATQQVLVARDPRVLGFLARDDEVVTALYLAPGVRGRGIGTMLLDAARDGMPRLHVWTYSANRGAIRFWSREGFRLIATTEGGDEGDGLPDLHMEWRAGEPE